MAVDSAHYRQLIVWQKAMAAAVELYRLAPLLPREETYGMRSQNHSGSGLDRGEHCGGMGPRDTERQGLLSGRGARFIGGNRHLLTLCEQLGWFPEHEADTLHALLIEVGKMLTTMRRRLRNPN